MIRSWSDKSKRLLRRLYPNMNTAKLARRMRRSTASVNSKAIALGLRKRSGRRLWTRADDATLRKLYPHRQTKEIVSQLNRPNYSIYGHANLLGLKKTKAFMRSPLAGGFQKGSVAGKRFRFPKGHPPWNKGMKGLQTPGSEKGWFKKGHRPANTKRDGHISLRVIHTGNRGGKPAPRPYYSIRIAKGKWKELHVLLWEKKHGRVPKGHRVMFKDGDSLHCTLRNLVLRTEAEAMAQTRDSDGWIAIQLARLKGKRGMRVNEALRDRILEKYPELIKAKRNQLRLQRLLRRSA